MFKRPLPVQGWNVGAGGTAGWGGKVTTGSTVPAGLGLGEATAIGEWMSSSVLYSLRSQYPAKAWPAAITRRTAVRPAGERGGTRSWGRLGRSDPLGPPGSRSAPAFAAAFAPTTMR